MITVNRIDTRASNTVTLAAVNSISTTGLRVIYDTPQSPITIEYIQFLYCMIKGKSNPNS